MKKISILFLVVVAALSACKKTPEVNLKYVDVERDLITVGTTTATVQCDYEYITTLKKAFFYYGEGTEEIDMNTAEMRVVQNTLYVDLAGLSENTTYSYYYEFVNGFNSMRSETKTFKTEEAPVEVILPTVITAEVTEIAENFAKGGGEVTDDGGADVTERGICWSANENPTVNDNHVAAGTGTGAFTAMMNGLEANTSYHVRAYAINEKGTAYGLDREFTTLSGGGSGNAPIGAIDGLFTINANGDKVYFSQGNLQYQASTNTWRFADNQWDFVGGTCNEQEYGTVYENGVKSDNTLISPTYDGWIDLFGWGTSGFNHGATCYQPWSTSDNDSYYYAYGSLNNNLNDNSGQADWGYNPISNGGNTINHWRTLSSDEWQFVLFYRNNGSNSRFAKAIINETKGIILFPDSWQDDNSINEINIIESNYESNIINISEWFLLESKGAVFLPASGGRHKNTFTFGGGFGTYGTYQTATISNLYESNVIKICFTGPMLYISGDIGANRYKGNAVRLVQDANSSPTPPTPPSGDHEYVDLGLPSGTLWATCNVGATTPEGYGDYFAWGETRPKSYYDWDNYKYCKGSAITLTKYCSNSDCGYQGFIDDLTTLLHEDDAATTNWGNDWRMPTQEEWQELLDNTTSTWTTQNGVNGRLFTAPNSNSIFLPAAATYEHELIGAGLYGDYWSSLLSPDDPEDAWHFTFGSDDYEIDPLNRFIGFSVRAVRSSK